jgi:NADH-quinone oxidoreductase subunit D
VGIATDARREHPYAAYGQLTTLKVASETGGDVYARFRIREQEIRTSINLIKEALMQLPAGPIAAEAAAQPNSPPTL